MPVLSRLGAACRTTTTFIFIRTIFRRSVSRIRRFRRRRICSRPPGARALAMWCSILRTIGCFHPSWRGPMEARSSSCGPSARWSCSANPDVQYVSVFENAGVAIGVTMPHPHGQIYAFPFIPPLVQTELDSAAATLSRTVGLFVLPDSGRRRLRMAAGWWRRTIASWHSCRSSAGSRARCRFTRVGTFRALSDLSEARAR